MGYVEHLHLAGIPLLVHLGRERGAAEQSSTSILIASYERAVSCGAIAITKAKDSIVKGPYTAVK